MKSGPEWTHEHCVRYEVARSCINTFIGYRSQWIHREKRKAAPDFAAIERWVEERRFYVAERRNISIRDAPEKLERIAREYGAEGRRLFEFSRSALGSISGSYSQVASYGKLPYDVHMSQDSSARLEARLPLEVHATLKRAAELQGRTLTDFVVSAAHEAACRAIAEIDLVRLSLGDQQRLADALLAPPEPAESLTRAVRRRRELLGP